LDLCLGKGPAMSCKAAVARWCLGCAMTAVNESNGGSNSVSSHIWREVWAKTFDMSLVVMMPVAAHRSQGPVLIMNPYRQLNVFEEKDILIQIRSVTRK
jgi:hypothetical protein